MSAPPLANSSGNITMISLPPDKFSSGFKPWGDYLYGTILIVIGVVSVIGNSLAVHVFRRKGKDITPPEVLLLNIALLDLTLAGASCPASIIAAFNHRWIFYEIGCVVYGAACYFLGLATIMSLTVLAVFRFVKIRYPEKVDRRLTASKIRSCVIPLVYAYSLLWTVLPLFGYGGYDVEPFGLSCTLAWQQPDQGKMYMIAVSAFCVILPCAAIVFSHLGILFDIRQAGGMFSNKETGIQTSKAELQFIKVSFGICTGFLLAWLPYTGVSFWSAFADPPYMPLWVTPIPVVMAKSSIAYNPFIYVMMTRRYRVDFSRALREILHLSGPKEETTLETPPRQVVAEPVLDSRSPVIQPEDVLI